MRVHSSSSICCWAVTIAPASLSIYTGSYSKACDGTPLTYDDGWLDGLIVDGSPTSTPPPDFFACFGFVPHCICGSPL